MTKYDAREKAFRVTEATIQDLQSQLKAIRENFDLSWEIFHTVRTTELRLAGLHDQMLTEGVRK